MASNYLKLALLGGLVFGTAGLMAQEAQEENAAEEKTPPTEEARAVEEVALADQLAILAIERGDAAMLVQAARLKASIPTQPAEASAEPGEPEPGAGAGAGAGAEAQDKEAEGFDLSVEALLDQAEVLAHGDEALLAMVTETREEVARTRGRVGGPGVSQNRVEAFSTNYYRGISFEGGQPARIWLAGDGDTDLDLYIFDENGNEICSSVGWNDREICSWTPRWTGPFSIEVRNLGSVWNAFTLTTN